MNRDPQRCVKKLLIAVLINGRIFPILARLSRCVKKLTIDIYVNRSFVLINAKPKYQVKIWFYGKLLCCNIVLISIKLVTVYGYLL